MKQIHFALAFLGAMPRAQFYRPLLALLFCFPFLALQAQLTPIGHFYRTQWQLANPAAIDRILMSYRSQHPDMQVIANLRPQWQLAGVDGAPLTGFFSFENAPRGAAYRKFPIRWGASFFADKTDVLSHYGFYGNYSRELRFDNSRRGGQVSKLRIGISGGYVLRQYSNWRPRDPTDPSFQRPDNEHYLDAAVGLFYQRFGRFGNVTYWGLSLPNHFATFNLRNTEVNWQDKFSQFYFVVGRYISSRKRDFDDAKIEWEPTLWVRGNPRRQLRYYSLFKNGGPPISVDASLRAYFQAPANQPAAFWLGMGVGTNRTVTAEFGINRPFREENNWQIGLAYTAPWGKNIIQLGHSFEINATYSFMRDRTSSR